MPQSGQTIPPRELPHSGQNCSSGSMCAPQNVQKSRPNEWPQTGQITWLGFTSAPQYGHAPTPTGSPHSSQKRAPRPVAAHVAAHADVVADVVAQICSWSDFQAIKVHLAKKIKTFDILKIHHKYLRLRQNGNRRKPTHGRNSFTNRHQTHSRTVKFYFFKKIHFATGFSGWRSVFVGRKVAKS